MAGRKQKSQAGRLRIVAGNWRSRLLDIADVEGLRPTSERVRETLFNWLAPRIHGARCLDAYAGTGALGLEALSRGAASVVFVEKSSVAAKQLRRNIDVLDARGATVRQQDALEFLRQAASGPFDIVFLDPPFADDLVEETCRLLDQHDLLADDALVYIELPRNGVGAQLPAAWHVQKNKTAGNVRYMLVSTGD
jgi:16S rRNA (guanine966-N2)-methyltransferase